MRPLVRTRAELFPGIMAKKKSINKKDKQWAEAKRRCRLSAQDVRMAKELGLNPRSLIKNIPSKSQPWKAPVSVWIREMYEKRQRKAAKKPTPLPRVGTPGARAGAAAPPGQTPGARTPAGLGKDDTMPVTDPDDLERVDREIRINELKAEAEELADGEMFTFESEDAPPEILEAFWKNVVETEKAGWTSSRRQLEADGVALPPPDQLDDRELAAKLREVFDGLAKRHTYVYHTDHLSDRELYEELWSEGLNEEFPEMTAESGQSFLDMIGSGSEEDTHVHLKYYADEEDRRRHREEWPDDEIPQHEDPPYDRDRHLPKPPETPGGPKWF